MLISDAFTVQQCHTLRIRMVKVGTCEVDLLFLLLSDTNMDVSLFVLITHDAALTTKSAISHVIVDRLQPSYKGPKSFCYKNSQK